MQADKLYKELTWCMNQAHRRYHTMNHLAEMFMLAATHHIQLTLVQRYAIMFHDIVYEIPAGPISNEELSAQAAEQALPKVGLRDGQVAHVAQIIRDTELHIPTIEQSALVIDLDLAGLALNYWQNLDLIRAEYRHLSDDEFKSGRIKWLKSMTERKTIFVSGFFVYLESQAIENITREIELLNGEGYHA